MKRVAETWCLTFIPQIWGIDDHILLWRPRLISRSIDSFSVQIVWRISVTIFLKFLVACYSQWPGSLLDNGQSETTLVVLFCKVSRVPKYFLTSSVSGIDELACLNRYVGRQLSIAGTHSRNKLSETQKRIVTVSTTISIVFFSQDLCLTSIVGVHSAFRPLDA